MKTSNLAFSRGQAVAGSDNIKILPLSDLQGNTSTYSTIANSTNYLPSVVPTGTTFHYVLEHLTDGTFSQQSNSLEYGIGNLTKNLNTVYLQREDVLQYTVDDITRPGISGVFPSYTEDSYLLIRSIIPTNYVDMLVKPNSVLLSSNDGNPASIVLTDNTVLGMKDGEIGAINSTDLQEIINTEIVDTISNNPSTLNLTTEEINLTNNDSKISAPMFQVKPVYTNSYRPANPQRGMIIFNSDANVFEGYDGSSWRQLNWT